MAPGPSIRLGHKISVEFAETKLQGLKSDPLHLPNTSSWHQNSALGKPARLLCELFQEGTGLPRYRGEGALRKTSPLRKTLVVLQISTESIYVSGIVPRDFWLIPRPVFEWTSVGLTCSKPLLLLLRALQFPTGKPSLPEFQSIRFRWR